MLLLVSIWETGTSACIISQSKAMRESLVARLGSWRERVRGAFPFASGVLAVLFALVFYSFLFPANELTERDVNEAIVSAMASATPRPPDAVRVYQIIQPSIVYIEAGFVDKEGKHSGGLGTGVIISDTVDIVTSLHVVEGSRDIRVTFADGTESEAFILAETPEMDIAILRAFNSPQLFIPATLGNPGSMRVGDDVFVVGNPYGLYSSMSAGVISGFGRSFHPTGTDLTLEGLIQFDAAANPGNSGGPLLDRNGRVIGIVTGVVSPSEVNFFVGIGFAVPITNATAGGGGSPPY
ncbi:MAG TPA: trypsin-like peptidase domain-containing protein [Anaerolineales bacterium]